MYGMHINLILLGKKLRGLNFNKGTEDMHCECSSSYCYEPTGHFCLVIVAQCLVCWFVGH